MQATSASTSSCVQALYTEARKPPTLRWPLMPTIPRSLASARNSSARSSLPGAITKQMFMMERSSLAAVPVKKGLRSISA